MRQAITTPAVADHSTIQMAPSERVPDERATGDDLMREGESQRQIGIEVNDPPRLVLQPATRIADGGHAAKMRRQNPAAAASTSGTW